jgi:glycosyltransferase involved in cell wall biosynthesis
MNIDKLSIIIPVYNEQATIHLILDRIKGVRLTGDIEKEIILVNDCSNDDTKSAILKYVQDNPEMQIKYFEHSINKGKGSALHRHFKSNR